jgi:hypothetical protein
LENFANGKTKSILSRYSENSYNVQKKLYGKFDDTSKPRSEMLQYLLKYIALWLTSIIHTVKTGLSKRHSNFYYPQTRLLIINVLNLIVNCFKFSRMTSFKREYLLLSISISRSIRLWQCWGLSKERLHP